MGNTELQKTHLELNPLQPKCLIKTTHSVTNHKNFGIFEDYHEQASDTPLIPDTLRKCHHRLHSTTENLLLRATYIHSLLCTGGDFYVIKL